MSMNKVFISGRIKGDPYEVAGRHRQFTRFRVVLPRERNRGGRSEGDSVLVEAAGRNAAQLLTLKDGAYLTLEGRLRATVIVNGDRRESTILVRVENYSLNVAPPATEESEQSKASSDEERPSKPRRRRNNRRRKNPEGASDQGEKKPEKQEKDSAPAPAKSQDKGQDSEKAKPEAKASDAPPQKAEAKSEAKKEEKAKPAPKEEAPKAPSGPPEMPSIKSVADESLKKDMPF